MRTGRRRNSSVASCFLRTQTSNSLLYLSIPTSISSITFHQHDRPTDQHNHPAVGATLRFWLKNKVGRLLIFQLKLVQNCLTKKSCLRATTKITRTLSFFCQNGQKMSRPRLVELPHTFHTGVSLACAPKSSY